MRWLKPDFKTPSSEGWYDIREDWQLIEASLATQYNIRIRHQNDMSWTEFCTLVSGIMPDTPLGQIVTIRAEKDQKTIKNFTPDQKRIHNEWKNRQAQHKLKNPEKLSNDMNELARMLSAMFGGGS